MVPRATLSSVPRDLRLKLLILLAVALVTACLHLLLGGTSGYSLADLWIGFRLGPNSSEAVARILWWNRLPRVLGCSGVGCGLAVVGCSYQAVFRNPLADPYTTGNASGAAVGGVLASLLITSQLALLARPIAAIMTGGLTLLLVMSMGRKQGQRDSTSLLLAGVVMGSFLHGVISFLLLQFGQDTNKVLRWLMGDTTSMFWPRIALMWSVTIVGSLITLRSANTLNAMAVGAEDAQANGYPVKKIQASVLLSGTIMVSSIVGSVGIIPFVGLVSPHISKRLLGSDYRTQLPGAALVGACLLLLADSIAQRSGEIPVGIVTALIGSPFLIILLRKPLV